MQDLDSVISQAATLIREARCAVVLTGAGFSTGSGLPDYRGTAGLWRNRSFRDLASITAFDRDTDEFWQFYRQRLDLIRTAEPNDNHRALTRMIDAGLISGVITQNIDSLHQKAGTDAVEMHGSLRTVVCRSCGLQLPTDAALAMTDTVPLCPQCESPLKPDIVLFGELLPMDALRAAAQLLRGCDLIIACGTSLEVDPVGAYPAKVHFDGGKVIIFNRGETASDDIADLRFDGDLEQIFPRLCEQLQL